MVDLAAERRVEAVVGAQAFAPCAFDLGIMPVVELLPAMAAGSVLMALVSEVGVTVCPLAAVRAVTG